MKNMRANICLSLCLFFAALLLLVSVSACADMLTLPAGTAQIDAEAFMGDTRLDTVVLPDGLLRIGDRAFAYSGVRRINLPDSLEAIGTDALPTGVTVFARPGTYACQWAEEQEFIPELSDALLRYSEEGMAFFANNGGGWTNILLSFAQDESAQSYLLEAFNADENGVTPPIRYQCTADQAQTIQGIVTLPVQLSPDYRQQETLHVRVWSLRSDGTVSKYAREQSLRGVPHPDEPHTGWSVWNRITGEVTICFEGFEDLPLRTDAALLIYLNGALCDILTPDSLVFCEGQQMTLTQLSAAYIESSPDEIAFRLSRTAAEKPQAELQKRVLFDGREYLGPRIDWGMDVTGDVPAIPIDEAHFPDDIFRQYVLEEADQNENSLLEYGEITAATDISLGKYNDVHNFQRSNILPSCGCWTASPAARHLWILAITQS